MQFLTTTVFLMIFCFCLPAQSQVLTESFPQTQQSQAAQMTASAEEVWRNLGPSKILTNIGNMTPGLGRIDCLYIYPKDTNRIYIGSRSAGFWRSDDEGRTWLGTTENLPSCGVNLMLVSNLNPDSILINVCNTSNGY